MGASEVNVLVVEDDDFESHMIVHMLRTLGVQYVSTASDGKQALALLRKEQDPPVDIVICDLNLPEMDGLEFMRHVSQESLNVAVIIVSALGNKLLVSAERMAKMYGIKLLGVIDKPLMPDCLDRLFARYVRTDYHWQPNSGTADFTPEAVLQGLQYQQFVAYFQPQLDMKTGRLVGAEALARWRNPELGLISPYAFIPVLEQSGAIDTLTLLMLEQAAALCRALHDDGIVISISVNLSSNCLGDTELANKITRVVHKAGIDPRYIVLEITESTAMTNMAYALENLARLCMRGFPLSIDDYGTGYSSMQQLTRVAFSELKIDQSFVSDFVESPASYIAVDSSLEIARKLQLTTVAEGVETQQQWDRLKAMGCDTAQGYFIARPMNLEAFMSFAKAHG